MHSDNVVVYTVHSQVELKCPERIKEEIMNESSFFSSRTVKLYEVPLMKSSGVREALGLCHFNSQNLSHSIDEVLPMNMTAMTKNTF